MNADQRKILKGALATIVLTLLFPPFAVYLANGIVDGQGFGFIFSWPHANATAVIHLPTLIAEWLAIGIVAAILWRLTRTEVVPLPGITALVARIDGNPAVKAAVRSALDQMD